MARILLVEDEQKVASFVSQGLEEEGHVVTCREDGIRGLEAATEREFDVILLDVRLPFMDGVELARRIRLHKPDVPVLMLTALNSVEDRVNGLRAGADDYLAKPFAFEELVARIDALLRRRGLTMNRITAFDGRLVFEPAQKLVLWHNEEIPLTIKEFDLLAYLVARVDRANSRDDILRDVWGERMDRGTNVIDVYVSYLRQKLEAVDCPAQIESVRGVGYRLRLDQ